MSSFDGVSILVGWISLIPSVYRNSCYKGNLVVRLRYYVAGVRMSCSAFVINYDVNCFCGRNLSSAEVLSFPLRGGVRNRIRNFDLIVKEACATRSWAKFLRKESTICQIFDAGFLSFCW